MLELTSEDRLVLNRDYSTRETTRADIEFYQENYSEKSGDVRLRLGLVRTEAEQREFIETGLALKLPGQKR